MNKEEIKKDLIKNFKNLGHPIAFSGITNIYNYYNGRLSINEIKDTLAKIYSYTLHKEAHKEQRNPSYTHFKRYQFQMDLLDVQALAPFNNDIRYLLTVIDTFTRYAFVRPIRNKTALEVLNAFKSVLQEAGSNPYHLVLDGGMEFHNQHFLNYCQSLGINVHVPDSSTHGAYIERFNRTIQDLIYKFLTEKNTNKYIDMLDSIVKSYNHRIHRMIKTTPYIAETNPNSHLKIRLIASKNEEKIKPKKQFYNIGDLVRVLRLRTKFTRGYQTRFVEEVFRIYKVDKKFKIPMYYIENWDGTEKIKGGFYSFELSKVIDPIFRIEKVLRRRVLNGVRQVFVKWKGYNDEHNSWINEADLENNFHDMN